MNKIQLEAILQLAEIDCENNPTPVNKNRVVQAKLACEAFEKAQEEPASEPKKPSKPAAPKKPSASAPKKVKEEKVIPDATADDADASAEEETDTDPAVDNTASADRDDQETATDSTDTAETTEAQSEETEEKKTQE
jgi:hypothetical protein